MPVRLERDARPNHTEGKFGESHEVLCQECLEHQVGWRMGQSGQVIAHDPIRQASGMSAVLTIASEVLQPGHQKLPAGTQRRGAQSSELASVEHGAVASNK